jgi:hypothetical protein
MPNLAGFAVFARKVGVVPPVPPLGSGGGTKGEALNTSLNQYVGKSVPPVPPVPPQNDEVENEADLQVAFEERAAILEYDGGWPRAEAERLARIEVFGVE